MGMSAPHKTWKQAKELASSLFNKGIGQGDYLAEAMGEKQISYPLKFDLKLGPQVDLLFDLQKQWDAAVQKSDSAKEGKLEDAVNKLGKRIEEIVNAYQSQCNRHKETLDKADKRICALLLGALDRVQRASKTLTHKDPSRMRYVSEEFKALHDRWKDAKKASEKAFSSLLKDKELGPLIKRFKLTSYPMSFKEGLGPALDKASACIKALDPKTPDAIKEVGRVAKEYRAEVEVARARYEQNNIKGPGLEKVFAPLARVAGDICDHVSK